MKNNESKSVGKTIFEYILSAVYVAGILGIYWKFITSVIDLNKEEK